MISICEFEALKESQRIMHQDEGLTGIFNNFYKPIEKTLWFSCNSISMNCSSSGRSYTYDIDSSYQYLSTTFLNFKTGEWRVKPEYIGQVKICLTKNFGYNLIEKASMYLNGSVCMDTFDSFGCDVYFGFNQTRGCGFRSSHERCIGNLKRLREWSDYIPDKTINFTQPFFYTHETYTSFPLTLFNSQAKFSLKYEFRDRIDLIKMKILKNNVWYEADNIFIKENLNKYITYNFNNVKTPELFSDYIKVSNNEIDFLRCELAKKLNEGQTWDIYYRSMKVEQCRESKSFSSDLAMNIVTKSPALALFWAGLNIDSLKYNNYSNYTIDTFGNYQITETCISNNSLSYFGDNKFKDTPSDHFTDAEARQHFRSVPKLPLILAKAIAWRPYGIEYDTGIIFDPSTSCNLSCKIMKRPDIFDKIKIARIEKGNTYVCKYIDDPKIEIILRILMQCKISINKSDPNNFESIQYITLS